MELSSCYIDGVCYGDGSFVFVLCIYFEKKNNKHPMVVSFVITLIFIACDYVIKRTVL